MFEMSSPTSSSFLEDNDLIMDNEPSLMDTGICPMSVFDKFGFDYNILGNDTDSLLNDLNVPGSTDNFIKTEDDFINSTSNPFRSLFSDILDGVSNVNELHQSSHSQQRYATDNFSTSSSSSPSSTSPSSSSSSSDFDDLFVPEPKPVIKSEPIVFDVEETLLDPLIMPVDGIKVEHDPLATDVRETRTPTVIAAAATTTTTTVGAAVPPVSKTNSLLTVPIKSSAGVIHSNFAKPGTKRMVKAVVVCPDRSKGIFYNVLPGKLNKGLILQNGLFPNGRSLLNFAAGGKVEATKLPIKVNVIAATKNHPIFALEKVKPKMEPIEIQEIQQQPIIAPSPLPILQTLTPQPPAMTTSTTNALISNECRIKIEFDPTTLPETPPSSTGGSDCDEFHPFSSPIKCDAFADNYMKTSLLDEDNLCGDSYKCFPPAEITGQVGPVIPDVFKYTPNSSPTNNGMQSVDGLDTFYAKLNGNQSGVGVVGGGVCKNVKLSSNQPIHYYNKAAANVDHDYGFTCRTPKTPTIFSADSLGIQTPSASEPPTDSDDDELNLDDIPLNFESSDLDREQQEYFENLKRQMQLAELSQTNREKERRSTSSSSSSNNNATSTASASAADSSPAKDRKTGKNRKRKYASSSSSSTSSTNSSKERLTVSAPDKHLPAKTKITWKVADSKYEATTAFTTGSGTVKVRLPANHQNGTTANTTATAASITSTTTATTTGTPSSTTSIKRKKNGSGGRIFSPIERHQHNTNEQVRRIEMRQSFEELRQLVPSLLDKPKAPKVSILQEAKMYCDELFHTDLKLQNQVTALKCQQDRMRNTLSQLRRYAAATRY